MKKILIILAALVIFQGCNFQDKKTEAVKNPEVVLELKDGDLVKCPYLLKGKARGNWFFEATLGLKLVDENGNVFLNRGLMTKDNWMTTDFVSFQDELYFQTDAKNGQLIVMKDNPSGLPENDAQSAYDVKFESCTDAQMQEYERAKVRKYIEENISALSPKAAVLGGKWYVTNVEFLSGQKVKVEYEDGHIQNTFEAKYEVDGNGNVILEVSQS